MLTAFISVDFQLVIVLRSSDRKLTRARLLRKVQSCKWKRGNRCFTKQGEILLWIWVNVKYLKNNTRGFTLWYWIMGYMMMITSTRHGHIKTISSPLKSVRLGLFSVACVTSTWWSVSTEISSMRILMPSHPSVCPSLYFSLHILFSVSISA